MTAYTHYGNKKTLSLHPPPLIETQWQDLCVPFQFLGLPVSHSQSEGVLMQRDKRQNEIIVNDFLSDG